MKAFNRAALLIALLAAVGALVRKDPLPLVVRVASLDPAQSESGGAGSTAPCPKGTLPDDAVCIPVPKRTQNEFENHPPRRAPAEQEGLPSLDEGILRWPERPATYDAYRFPVHTEPLSVRGLGEPDNTSFALLLSGPAGSPITTTVFEGQVGKTKVLFAEASSGKLITLHTVEQGARSQRYLLFSNLMTKLEPSLTPGLELEPSFVVGALGAAALELAAFRLRDTDPSDLGAVEATRLLTPAYSVPCDLRNLLPLK